MERAPMPDHIMCCMSSLSLTGAVVHTCHQI